MGDLPPNEAETLSLEAALYNSKSGRFGQPTPQPKQGEGQKPAAKPEPGMQQRPNS